jgi:stage II sporulation protein AB (anti-sigma F factor)
VDNKIKLEFSSLPDNVALARLVIAALAGQMEFTLSDVEELKVAVSEAVSNCIIHGYDNRPDGSIVLEAWKNLDRIKISVTDQGKGIEDIGKAMEPAFSTKPERMGLGFVFMQSFMDDLEVNSKLGQGTMVTLTKKIDSSQAQLKTSQN